VIARRWVTGNTRREQFQVADDCRQQIVESRGNRRRAGIGITGLRTFPARASNPIVIVPGFA
jgi:hypothetical protein